VGGVALATLPREARLSVAGEGGGTPRRRRPVGWSAPGALRRTGAGDRAGPATSPSPIRAAAMPRP